MDYATYTDSNEISEITADHHLLLDGTVSLDGADEDSIPRVKGLVELVLDYFGD